MTIKDLYASGIQYNEFLESDIEEYKLEAIQKWNTNKVTEEFERQVKELQPVKLLCFMELYCPDCMVLAPVIEKMKKINLNFDYRIVPRRGNESIQQRIVGENEPLRIPTIVKIEGETVKTIYIELPEVVKEQISNGEIEEEAAIQAYREGVYSYEIQKQLLDGLSI